MLMLLLLLLLLLLGDSVVVSRQIAVVGFGQLNPSQLVQKGGILNKKKRWLDLAISLVLTETVCCSPLMLQDSMSPARYAGVGFGQLHKRRNFKDANPLMSSLLVIFVWGGVAIL